MLDGVVVSRAAARCRRPQCRAQLCGALDRLEALPVVKDAKAEAKPHLGRVICNMWCGCKHSKSSLRQPAVLLNKKPITDAAAVPSFLVPTEKLIIKIAKEQHAGCLAAAEAAKAEARQITGEHAREQLLHGSHACPRGR